MKKRKMLSPFIALFFILTMPSLLLAGEWTTYQVITYTEVAYTGILIKHTNSNPDSCTNAKATLFVYLELKDEIDYTASAYSTEDIYKTSIRHSAIYDDTMLSKYEGTKVKYYISGCSANGFPCITKNVGDILR